LNLNPAIAGSIFQRSQVYGTTTYRVKKYSLELILPRASTGNLFLIYNPPK